MLFVYFQNSAYDCDARGSKTMQCAVDTRSVSLMLLSEPSLHKIFYSFKQ